MEVKIKSIQIDLGDDWQYFDGSIFYTIHSLDLLARRIKDAEHEGWDFRDIREDRDVAGIVHIKFERKNANLPSRPID